MPPRSQPLEPVRSAIARQIRGVFREPDGSYVHISRDGPGLFGPRAIIHRVHGDVTTMMIGGVSALLLQMLHPIALTGVWEHSRFRDDMSGRLRRTSAFIAVTTYAARAQAEADIARVKAIHERVRGLGPDGTPYAASDPELLAFIHTAEALSFLGAFMRYRDPLMPVSEQDRYAAEIGEIALALGADPVPVTRAGLERHLREVRPVLRADARTAAARRAVLGQKPPSAAMGPFQALTFQAGIDLLPGWARAMHGFDASRLGRPLLRAGAGGLAATVRWAMRAQAT